MRDSEVVASITAGDPLGLAEAYDRYSGPLFGYCQTLLDEPADAADAVQDTFVIAASKLSTLRDPERLRAWLFAVARNECLHRLKSRRAAAPLAVAVDRADDSADVSEEAERAEARALIRAAVGGLNAGERDVINQLWHGLEVREVAAVLGVSRNHAYSLFSRALDQLETSVGVLLVGRAGRKDCRALDQLLAGWDGRLTAGLRKRVGRHIDRCQVCSDRRRQALTPALLFDLTPAAILALAVAHRPAGPIGPAGHPLPSAHPAGPHADVLRLTASQGPLTPAAAHPGHLALARVAHLPLALAGGTVATTTVTVAVTATAVATAVMPNVHVPTIPGRGVASVPIGVSAPPDRPATGIAPPAAGPARLTARSVTTRPAAKARAHGGKAQAHGSEAKAHGGNAQAHGGNAQAHGSEAKTRGNGQGSSSRDSPGLRNGHGNVSSPAVRSAGEPRRANQEVHLHEVVRRAAAVPVTVLPVWLAGPGALLP